MRSKALTGVLAFLVIACSPAARHGELPLPAQEETVRLRVLTYNIHHGVGEDGRLDLARLAAVIAAAHPDLVALQEVDVGVRRSQALDEASELGRLTGMHALFGVAMPHDGGEYGEAVLSRAPILASAVHPLPHRAGSEPRAALAIRVRPFPNRPELVFVATHLDHQEDAADRLMQVRELLRVIGEEARPLLLAGDLNARPDTAELAAFHEFVDAGAAAGATFPSSAPDRRIDYVLLREKTPWRVVETRVIDERIASDHCPLLVVLEWP